MRKTIIPFSIVQGILIILYGISLIWMNDIVFPFQVEINITIPYMILTLLMIVTVIESFIIVRMNKSVVFISLGTISLILLVVLSVLQFTGERTYSYYEEDGHEIVVKYNRVFIFETTKFYYQENELLYREFHQESGLLGGHSDYFI